MAQKALPFIEKTFGPYPYKQFSFIHGGDGGMEYPMATLIIGPGAALHEWMHSWYYGMLATNESLYAWMDEGFTQYAEERVNAWLNNKPGFAQADNYAGYVSLAKSGKEEPLTTHADHYNTNYAYSLASYLKGAVFMEQLGYIVGAGTRDNILLEYYRQWRFKHPNASDFMRVAEKVSGLKLDWYKEYWVNSTKTIDYAIDSLWEEGRKTKIRLSRIGLMPMPVDLQLSFKDGTKELHYIPLNLMYGEKPIEDNMIVRKNYEAWKWTQSTYIIETTRKLTDITVVEIDPSLRLADIERRNNKLELKW
jgi:aminopeptidase N